MDSDDDEPNYIQMIKDAMSDRSSRRKGSRGGYTSGDSKERQSGSGKNRTRSKSPRNKSAKSAKSAKSEASQDGQEVDTGPSVRSGSAASRRVAADSARLAERGLRMSDMSGRGLATVSTSLFSSKDIGELDLSSNNLRSIPPDIRKLVNLVVLDMSRNGLRCTHSHDFTGLPAELGQLPSLHVILLAECNLQFVPPAVWKCQNLKVLDISRNKIGVLPPEVGNLELLEHLNVQQANLSTLPPEMAFCQQLQELLLWGNTIDTLPDTMRELTNLRKLALNYRGFCSLVDGYMENLLRKGQIQSEHLPPVLFELPALEVLDLEGTKINSLPEVCAARLNELYLINNFFQTLPAIVMNMTSLKLLELSDNLLTALPEAIKLLVNLEVLRANNNSIEVMPVTIGSLQQLQELAMGGNKLRHLPVNIGKLSSLCTLVLDRNALTSLPESITQLVNLETLDLTENNISALPLNLHFLTSLQVAHSYRKFQKYGLWLHKNPLTTPPHDMWKTDTTEKIYGYLKKLQIRRTENLQRQKLVVLGQSQCGKTSLIQSMSGGKSCMTDGASDSTMVANNIPWITDNDVSLMVCDLGGDPVYKPLHYLLLDRKALYMLVYDHRNYSTKHHQQALGYWLDLLLAQCPGAVVKVVGTHCDLCYPDIIQKTQDQVMEALSNHLHLHQQRLQQQLTVIEEKLAGGGKDELLLQQQELILTSLRHPLRLLPGVSLVSSADGIDGIPNLITELEMIAVNKEYFPHAQRYVPPAWERFKLKLKAIKSHFIPWSEVVKISKEFLMAEKPLSDCMQHLHDIGDIMWFRSNPQLSDIVFHRPVSMLDIFQGLFRHNIDTFLDYDSNRIFAHKGQFSVDTFQEAKDRFTKTGQISRHLLQCMWFYLKLDTPLFYQLADLVPKLDLGYLVPQPDIPEKGQRYHPMMVIPVYNCDRQMEAELTDLWEESPLHNELELEVKLTFPTLYPAGVLEKVACRLQPFTVTRADWQDCLYAELPDACHVLVRRQLHGQTYDCVMTLHLRADDVMVVQQHMTSLWDIVQSVLELSPGLVHYTDFNIAKTTDPKITLEQCFPPRMLQNIK